MTVSKSTVQNVLHGSANAAGTQSKIGRLFFAVIFQRVRHLCCEKTTHTFFFLKNIWQGWKLQAPTFQINFQMSFLKRLIEKWLGGLNKNERNKYNNLGNGDKQTQYLYFQITGTIVIIINGQVLHLSAGFIFHCTIC